ncbi:Gustatory receptor 90 [Hyalella azteca]|uniref:Gustatory receptor 90 n=1 Tax=Hyalella azteca TaxID=294128 RepID=A0A6A0H0G4_HYAAZ|nr:Gustatory receptor 90 [Hyalella azteca]
MTKSSWQRWFEALKFTGLYLERKKVVSGPDDLACNVLSSDFIGMEQKSRERDRWVEQDQRVTAICFKNLPKLTWYLAMNSLYLACVFYIIGTRDYSDGSMTGIFFIAWSITCPVMIAFSILKCISCQRILTELFEAISPIYHCEPSLAHRPYNFNWNTCLLICLAAAQMTTTCVHFKICFSDLNENNFDNLRMGEALAYLVMYAVALTFILSFNFYIGVLKNRFQETSTQLVDHGTLLSEYDVTEIQHINAISVTSTAHENVARPQPPTSSFLKEIEFQMLLIDRAIERITQVYSWILIFLSIWFLTDLLFGIYLLLTPSTQSDGILYLLLYICVITEALCCLFLMHNPADELSEAEEEFIVNLRMFIYRLPDDQQMKPSTGLIISLQRSRKLTLCNFGTIGRGSFLNALAFMFSYVVVIIQFRDAETSAGPTTLPTNAGIVHTNASIVPANDTVTPTVYVT